ncbi:MAG: hypothetical protein U1F57_07910 [bacterium]
MTYNTTTVLSRLSESNLYSSASLSAAQSQIDGIVSNFVEEAGNARNLAAIATGSLAYRFGRIGALAFASRAGQAAPLLSLASYGIGLGAEVTAFEGTSRLLATAAGDRSNANLWNWSGRGGWANGLASSFISFGLLKSAGYAAREQNVLLQHLFSDLAMVGGNQGAAAFGFIQRPEGSFAEQMLHAEVTNLHLGAGLSLMHSFAPGLHALERSLDLSTQALQGDGRGLFNQGPSFLDQDGLFNQPPSFFNQGPDFVPVEGRLPGGDLTPPSSREESIAETANKPLLMAIMGNGRGNEAPLGTTRVPASSGERVELGEANVFLIPNSRDPKVIEQAVRDFVRSMRIPGAAAYMGDAKLGKIFATNDHFTRDLGYTEEAASSVFITKFFPLRTLAGIFPKIKSILNGGVFPRTALLWNHPTEGEIPIYGWGVVRRIGGKNIAFAGYQRRSSSSAQAEGDGDAMLQMLMETDKNNQLQMEKDGTVLVHSTMGLNILFSDPESPINAMFSENDLRIRVTGGMTDQTLQTYPEVLCRFLNVQARKLEIPTGRRLRLEIPAQEGRRQQLVTLLKGSEGFSVLGGSSSSEGNGASHEKSPPPPAAASPTVHPKPPATVLKPAAVVPQPVAPRRPVSPARGGILDRVTAALEGRDPDDPSDPNNGR